MYKLESFFSLKAPETRQCLSNFSSQYCIASREERSHVSRFKSHSIQSLKYLTQQEY